MLSPFGSPPRQRREYAKENSKLFQKSFAKNKMRPTAKRNRAQRKYKQHYNDVCSPIKSEYPVVVGGLFLKKDLSVYVDTKITRQHLLDTTVS
ncbi:hypothetical protein [Anaerostipes hominis (ex Lee et al. 2021)]|uniref:Uncharacterized protein n=1 Tax=Anaerostipes hominis (ex Lee et al. 2021) TaxID=2025494 RepID=A0ABV4DEL6_9FIRM|nr:hypothetical protein [Anaerostipes hominis (ex Lee et al. 2021)]